MSDRVRLSKLLAERGVASRREAERLIAEGAVSVNGDVATDVVPVDPEHDAVRVQGRPLPKAPPKRTFVLYKPKGVLTTRDDPDGRPSVGELMDTLPLRVEPVGRLDMETEGALLLTNDGDLANALTHPSTKVPKRYVAKVYRTPDDKDLHALRRGVMLEDGRTAPAKARVLERTDGDNAWLEITVTEGRNRLVRRMCEALGHPVSKLRRESFATISIRDMSRGQIRELTGTEMRRIADIARGVAPSAAGKKRGKGFAKPKPKKPRHGKHKSSVQTRGPRLKR